MRKINNFLILRITILEVTKNRDRSAHRLIMLLSGKCMNHISDLEMKLTGRCNSASNRHLRRLTVTSLRYKPLKINIS